MTKREVIRLRYCSVLQLLCEITCPLVTVHVMDHLKRKKTFYLQSQRCYCRYDAGWDTWKRRNTWHSPVVASSRSLLSGPFLCLNTALTEVRGRGRGRFSKYNHELSKHKQYGCSGRSPALVSTHCQHIALCAQLPFSKRCLTLLRVEQDYSGSQNSLTQAPKYARTRSDQDTHINCFCYSLKDGSECEQRHRFE